MKQDYESKFLNQVYRKPFIKMYKHACSYEKILMIHTYIFIRRNISQIALDDHVSAIIP